MNKYLKNFMHRGLVFGGFGPVVAGIVYAMIENSVDDFALGGGEVCLAIISSYMLAFIQAGASVFNQIEHWPITKSLAVHFITLFLAYSTCYIINKWIPFEPMVLVIFAIIFIVSYFAIWTVVYLSVKSVSRKMNKKIS